MSTSLTLLGLLTAIAMFSLLIAPAFRTDRRRRRLRFPTRHDGSGLLTQEPPVGISLSRMTVRLRTVTTCAATVGTFAIMASLAIASTGGRCVCLAARRPRNKSHPKLLHPRNRGSVAGGLAQAHTAALRRIGRCRTLALSSLASDLT